MLASKLNKVSELISFRPASEPPLMPKVTSAPEPLACISAPARSTCSKDAGIVDPLHAGVALEELGHRQRILRVTLHAERERFRALQQQKCVEGESAAPVSRRPCTRALRMNAKGPNASCS